MQRLKLDLDTLEVQSFATTGPSAGPGGTVHGQMVAVTDDPETCAGSIGCYSLGCATYGCATAGENTCVASCYGSACDSCHGSCNFDCPSDGCVGNDTSYGYTFLVSCSPPTR
jgi:hypothetical protein